MLRSLPVSPHFPRGRAEAGDEQGRLQPPLRNSFCFLVSLPALPDRWDGPEQSLESLCPSGILLP